MQIVPAVDERDGHPVGVLHSKTILVELLDGPRRRKTAFGSLDTMRT
jgi:CBS domain containing-hemolysin-like protein